MYHPAFHRRVFSGSLVIIRNLPHAMNLNLVPSPMGGTISYADDVLWWILGPPAEAIKLTLESRSKAVVDYMATNYMALNPSKAKIPWVSSRSRNPNVAIKETTIAQVDTT